MKDSVLTFLILLEESFLQDFSLQRIFEDKIDNSADKHRVRRAIQALVSDGAAIEISSEHDVLEYLSLDHSEHGILKSEEISVFDDFQIYSLGPNVASFIDQYYLDLVDGAEAYGLKKARSNVLQYSFDSAKWTGRHRISFKNSENIQLLKSLIKDVDARLSKLSLTNEEVFQARGLITAAQTLLELPEPPDEIIWRIIGRLASIAGLASFIKSFIDQFSGS